MTDERPAPNPTRRHARVSSFCSGHGCVGVVPGDEVTVVDTKLAAGPELRFTREEWAAFVAGVKNGEFDLG